MSALRLRSWQADLLLFAATAVWGLTFPLAKLAVAPAPGGVPVSWFLGARCTLAVALLVALFPRRLARLPRAGWGAGLLVGLFIFAGFALQTLGISMTTSAKAGFITGLSMVLVPVCSIFWLRLRPDLGTWLGVASATVGLGLLSLTADVRPSAGDLLVLLCACAFALHITGVSRFGGAYDPIALTIVQMGVCMVGAWIWQLAGWHTFTPGPAAVNWWGAPANVGVAVLVCGVLATAGCFLLMNWVQPQTTATRAALALTAEPVWAGVFSYFMVGEAFTPRGYLGAALIVLGMVLAEVPLPRRHSATPAEQPVTPPVG